MGSGTATPALIPRFTDWQGHTKLAPIGSPRPPDRYLLRFLTEIADRLGRPPGRIRILDVGCGRGDTVAWLCDQGWDAYGVDVADTYLAQGRAYLAQRDQDRGRLRLIESDRYPFPDGWFDVVISDQVLEHVPSLEGLAREITRVSRPGAQGMHIFPARWRPVEVHMHTPLVHWLPKGSLRRAAITTAVRTGLAAPHFRGLPFAVRASVFATFSEEETFYRPLRDIRRVFEEAGLAVGYRAASRAKVRHHLPRVPDVVTPFAALIYRHLFSVCLRTTREG